MHRGALLIHHSRGLICKNPSTAMGGPPPLSRRGELKTRFLTRRRVRYESVETGAHSAPLQVGANIAHRGLSSSTTPWSPANFAKQIRRRSACRRLSPLGKANVLRTSPFSVIMLFRMIVGLLLASPAKGRGTALGGGGVLQIRPRDGRRAPYAHPLASS